jgi:hypothetical protein
MPKVFWASVAVAVAVPSLALGQSKTSSPAKVLTVCEVLGRFNQYADHVVAVVGRMERSVSLEDHHEFLAQDGCENPVTTEGHVWLNKIEVWSGWEEGVPRPPSDRPEFNHDCVAMKLSVVRKSTTLGVHDELRITTTGGSTKVSEVKVPNQWAVVYGRIVKLPKLDEKGCGLEGCGGDDWPLVLVAEPYNGHVLREDGTILPDSKPDGK